MSDDRPAEQNNTVVDAYYQAGVEGRLQEFARYLQKER
jgi:hypothetical protein